MTATEIKGIQVELWMRIKKASKYYYQGVDPKTDKPVMMPVNHLRPECGEYIYEAATGVYRREDIDLFARRQDDTFQKL